MVETVVVETADVGDIGHLDGRLIVGATDACEHERDQCRGRRNREREHS